MTSLIQAWNKLSSPPAQDLDEGLAPTGGSTVTYYTGNETAATATDQSFINFTWDPLLETMDIRTITATSATTSDSCLIGSFPIGTGYNLISLSYGAAESTCRVYRTTLGTGSSTPTDAKYDSIVQFYKYPHWQVDKKEEIRNTIQQNLQPKIEYSRHGFIHVIQNLSEAELKALALLKKMILPADFRRYLKNGFLIVQGQSGIQYKITRSSHMVYASFCGKRLASLCIYVPDSNIPKTDEVITRLVMIQCHEESLWKGANVYYYPEVNKNYLKNVVVLSQKFSEARAFASV